MTNELNHRGAEFTEGPERTGAIIRAAIEVHRHLGPGLLESAYEECLCHELHSTGIPFTRQVPLPVMYKGTRLDCGYKLDIVAYSDIIIELKSVQALLPIHAAQILTYIKLNGSRVGLLINFNTPVLKDGLKRFIR